MDECVLSLMSSISLLILRWVYRAFNGLGCRGLAGGVSIHGFLLKGEHKCSRIWFVDEMRLAARGRAVEVLVARIQSGHHTREGI